MELAQQPVNTDDDSDYSAQRCTDEHAHSDVDINADHEDVK
ncbi:MAG: hypothetical protein ABI947_21445 [Chloroflexota bacterium]